VDTLESDRQADELGQVRNGERQRRQTPNCRATCERERTHRDREEKIPDAGQQHTAALGINVQAASVVEDKKGVDRAVRSTAERAPSAAVPACNAIHCHDPGGPAAREYTLSGASTPE